MENIDIIKNSFSTYLKNIKNKNSKDIRELYLERTEYKELTYGIYITFYIVSKYNINIKSSNKVIRNTVDDIYKFSNFESFFTSEKTLNFYYIFI